MANTIVIGCRLPHGLVLSVPGAQDVTLNGANKSPAFQYDGAVIVLNPEHYGSTEVDKSFWDTWLSLNPEFPAVKSGALFVANSQRDADAKNRELLAEKTGFEAMAKSAPGVAPVKA